MACPYLIETLQGSLHQTLMRTSQLVNVPYPRLHRTHGIRSSSRKNEFLSPELVVLAPEVSWQGPEAHATVEA